MGRHRKDEEDRRHVQLNIRLTDRERLRLEHRASALGLSLSEYVRDRGLGYRMPRLAAQRQIEARAITALNGIGNNLNQVTHHLNAGWASSGTDAAVRTLAQEIAAAMRGLLRGSQTNRGGHFV